jgi:hypothetical protein
MNNIVIIFSNKSSLLNKKLLKFFQINLLSLNNAKMVFDFEVAHPDYLDDFIERGVKSYPTLLQNDIKITGVDKIIDHLKKIVQSFNNKIVNKTESERVEDYWTNTIGVLNESGVIEGGSDNEEDDESAQLQKKIHEAYETRNSDSDKNIPSKRKLQTKISKNNKNKPPIKQKPKMKGGDDIDDQLMEKFFANQVDSLADDASD